MSPGLSFAKENAPIVLPPAQVTVASAFPRQPAPESACQAAATGEASVDPPTGLIWAPGHPLNLKEGSPALIGAPMYVSGNSVLTSWGLSWVSDNDQTVGINADGSLTWTDGSGAESIFFRVSGSTAATPSYVSPPTIFSTMTAMSLSGGVPTQVSERDPNGTTQLFAVFDSTSVLRLSRLTDRNGNFVNFTRDGQGRLTQVTDVHGRTFTMTYNAASLVARLDDSGGRTSTFSYDSRGRRTSETGPAGTTSYAYDSQNRLTKITYPSGGVRNVTYDSQNRVLTEDDGNGVNQMSYSYGPNSTTMTDALSHHSVLGYLPNQGLMQLSRLTDPAGRQTSFTYDSRANLTSQTDALGRTTHFSFDALGNVTQVQDAAGGLTRATYETTFGQPTSLTDPLNHTANLSYDGQGNLTQAQDPLSNTATFGYDSFGHVIRSQDPLGNVTNFTYDSSNGALYSIKDPLNRTITLKTDALSRVVKMTDSSGNATQYQYDTASDLTQVTDAMNGVTQFTYGPGRGAKLLASVKDALNHTTSMAFDSQGRLTGMTNALNQTATISYDVKGRIASTKTRSSKPFAMSYDVLDRMTGVSTPEGMHAFAYDAVGNLTSASHPNGSALSFSYDALNRVVSLSETLDSQVSDSQSFGYDANGNRTSLSSSYGSFTYSYDALNHLTTLSGQQGTIGFLYDAAGRMTSLTYPNGVRATFAYDSAGQVLQVLHQRTSDQITVASVGYSYDANGNRSAMLDRYGAHSYGYDLLNRLTQATHPAASGLPVLNEPFAYDAIGNRLADAHRTGYQYDAANRIVSDSSFTYTSDPDGNRTSITSRETNQTTSYRYDSASRLIEVDGPSNDVIATYKYDPVGRRIQKNAGGSINEYLYDGPNVRTITDGAGNVLAAFTYIPGLVTPLAMQVPTTRAGFVAGTYFFHMDALGSVIALTDLDGNLVETYEYEAFGRPMIRDVQGGTHGQSTVGNPFMFAGTLYDPESGLYHMGFRNLDADTGRFLEEDPVPAMNQFAYSLNRPISASDPLGLMTKWEQFSNQTALVANFTSGVGGTVILAEGLATVLTAATPAGWVLLAGGAILGVRGFAGTFLSGKNLWTDTDAPASLSEEVAAAVFPGSEEALDVAKAGDILLDIALGNELVGAAGISSGRWVRPLGDFTPMVLTNFTKVAVELGRVAQIAGYVDVGQNLIRMTLNRIPKRSDCKVGEK